MRTGGPYRIEFSYVGYRTAIFTGISLKLAETYVCDAKLKESAELDEVVVIGTASKFAGEKPEHLPILHQKIFLVSLIFLVV